MHSCRLFAVGPSDTVVSGVGCLLASIMIYDREASATLKVIQRDVRTNETILIVVRWLVVPRLLAAYSTVSQDSWENPGLLTNLKSTPSNSTHSLALQDILMDLLEIPLCLGLSLEVGKNCLMIRLLGGSEIVQLLRVVDEIE